MNVLSKISGLCNRIQQKNLRKYYLFEVLLTLILLVGLVPNAFAQFEVTNTDDSGNGSFRWAVDQVNASSGTQTITFNIPGSGPHVIQPATQYISFTNSVIIDGASQPGYAEGAPAIVLDGSLGGDISALVFTNSADNSTVRGLSIINFESYGIRLVGGSSTIEGNLIGLDPSGNVAGNGTGIGVISTTGNQIGGTAASQRNVISGNNIGIDLQAGSGNNIIEGNYIGTTLDGTASAGNKFNLQIRGSSNNIVGGSSPGQRNIIAGAFFEIVDGENEGGSGIVITSGFLSPENRILPTGNTIQGNYIGTDITGDVALPNERAGVLLLFGSTENTVGGSASGEGNLISGNGQYGIFLQGDQDAPVESNDIEGNIIGLNSSETAALGNSAGIFLWGENNSNQIGGINSGASNIIAGNSNSGIVLFEGSNGNSIVGNRIGLNSSDDPFGNGVHGVDINGSSGNFIGGTLDGQGNIIAHNNLDGVEVTDSGGLASVNNSILGNEIYGNGGIGIDLAGDGLTQNDNLDTDSGPNNLQNSPDIKSFDVNNDQLSITYDLSSDPANTSYPVRVEFFQTNTNLTQSRAFLGSDSYTATTYGNGTGNKTITITLPSPVEFTESNLIVATATDAAGNTSELSMPTTGKPFYVVTNTNDVGSGTLREAMTLSGYSPTTEYTIEFDIPGTPPFTIAPESPLPTLVKPVTINGASQPGYSDGSNIPPPIIEISGINAGTANGLNIRGGNSRIEALIINHFSDAGISISDNGSNTIINCYIGTNIAGNSAASNGLAGIFIDNVENNIIFDNLISGNNVGIFLQQTGAIGNTIEENTIGLNVDGTAAIPNSVDGIRLANGPSGNGIISNTISGNDGNGIYVLDLLDMGTSDNTILGNVIGTNQSVTARVPNQRDGIRIEQSDNNDIDDNIISGNGSNGIEILGEFSTGNVVVRNIIGLADDGTTKLLNRFSGVVLEDASDNTIGGDISTLSNLISGNGGIFEGFFLVANGIRLRGNSTGNKIQGNYIGTDLNGIPSSETGNSSDGIKIEDQSSNNIIGSDGTAPGLGNIIAGNGITDASGVTIAGNNSLNNRISSNSIYANFTTGIDLGDDGVTDNDADDSITGPNNLQNHPVISSVIYDNGSSALTVNFLVPSDPVNSDYPLRIEFYKNDGNRQGEIYLGSEMYEAADFGTDKEVTITLTQNDLIAEGDEITALAISATGNTSEFGSTAVVESPLTAPETPLLTTPVDEAVGVSVSPQFTWQASVDAQTYELQASTVSDFSSTVISETGITNTEFQAPQLSYSTLYYWRVRAVNSAGQSDWSTNWSYTTEAEPLSPPEVVTLSSPADQAVDVPINPTLSWEATTDAASYNVQLSLSNDFTTQIVDEADVTSTELAVADLAYETPYYWRVRAVNSAGNGGWSQVWSFTTETEPVNPPEAVALLSPANQSQDISLDPTLEWEESTNADSYSIQLSEVDQFTSYIVNAENVTSVTYSVEGLSGLTEYFWRVKAVNADGESPWSQVWSFTTMEATSIVDESLGLPETLKLSQNYPNPFNPTTQIELALPEAGDVRLHVFDMLGRQVGTIIDQRLAAGRYSFSFDASYLTSGTYIYRIATGSEIRTRKMTLIK